MYPLILILRYLRSPNAARWSSRWFGLRRGAATSRGRQLGGAGVLVRGRGGRGRAHVRRARSGRARGGGAARRVHAARRSRAGAAAARAALRRELLGLPVRRRRGGAGVSARPHLARPL